MPNPFANIGATKTPPSGGSSSNRFESIGVTSDNTALVAPAMGPKGVAPMPVVSKTTVVKKPAKKSNVFADVGQSYKDLYEGNIAEHPDSTGGILLNTVAGIPKATVKTAKDILQGIARSVATVGITAGNAVADAANAVQVKPRTVLEPFPTEIPTDTTRAGRIIFGGKPVRDIKGVGENAKNTANELASAIVGHEVKPVKGPGGLALGVGGILMDLSGFGGGKAVNSASGAIPEAFFKFLAKETKPAVIETALKNTGLDAVNAKNLAAKFAETKTVNEAKDVLANHGAAEIGSRAIPKEGKPAPTGTPKEILAQAEAGAAHLSTTKPLAGSGTQVNRFAQIGASKQVVASTPQKTLVPQAPETAPLNASNRDPLNTDAVKYGTTPEEIKRIFPDYVSETTHEQMIRDAYGEKADQIIELDRKAERQATAKNLDALEAAAGYPEPGTPQFKAIYGVTDPKELSDFFNFKISVKEKDIIEIQSELPSILRGAKSGDKIAIEKAKLIAEEFSLAEIKKMTQQEFASRGYTDKDANDLEEIFPGLFTNKATKTPDSSLSIPQSKPKTAIEAADRFYNEKVLPEIQAGRAAVMGADDLKDHFGNDYDDVRHKEIYSPATFDTYKRALKDTKGQTVALTGGGPGAGKTELVVDDLKTKGFNGVIYDSNLSSVEGAKNAINEARAAGKKVEIYGVLPDLDRARSHTIIRENKTTRGISDETFGHGHFGFPDVVRTLLEDGTINAEDVHLLDTRNITTKEEALAKAGNSEYVENPLATVKFLGYTKENIISNYAKEHYESTTGQRRSPLSGGKETGRAPNQNRPNQGSNAERGGTSRELGTAQKGRENKTSRGTQDLAQLRRMLQREYDSLAAAKANPAAHQKAYGENRIPKYEARIQALRARISASQPTPKSKRVTAPEARLPGELARRKIDIEQRKEALASSPYQKLIKYLNKNGQLPEVTGKGLNVFARKGDEIIQEIFGAGETYGAAPDSETVRTGMEKYLEQRKALREDQKAYRQDLIKARDEIALEKISEKAGSLTDIKIGNESTKSARAQEKLRFIQAVEKQLKQMGSDRAAKIKAITDFFNLTDADRKGLIRLNADFRTMTEPAFENLLKAIEGKAYDIEQKRNALMEVLATINDKELKKVDNFRQAMKLKKLENMSVSELNHFNDLLSDFEQGDTFLGKRTIQTAKLTSLGDIRTVREAKEHLAKESGVPVTSVTNVTPAWIDEHTSDIHLRNKNPFYRVMVDNTMNSLVRAAQREHAIDETFQKLMRVARKSRPRSLVDKLIPTDELVYRYNEVSPSEQLELAKQMTAEELEVAQYIDDYFTKARDYLLEIESLKRYVKAYIPRTHMGVFEYLKNHGREIFSRVGAKAFLKEILEAEQLQKQSFKIMEDNTGEVLPKQKFFKYSISREGHLNPSKNVGKVFMDYVRTFEKMRQLNEFVPKLDLYANILTNTEVKTRFGLVKDNSLNTFVKTWLNNKRGRPVKIGFARGTIPDTAIRFAIAFTRLVDLGFNIPVGLASNIGAQVATYTGIGEKAYAQGIYRFNTRQGKKIIDQYKLILGKGTKETLRDVSKTLGEKALSLPLALFGKADRTAKSVWLLGRLTPAEFQAGKISPERLTEIRLDIGRYHMSEGTTSISGSTSIGSGLRQYKSWALPLITTSRRNLREVARMARSGEKAYRSNEFKELLRTTLATIFIVLAGYEGYSSLSKKKEKTFLEKIAMNAYQESLSILSALNPTRLSSIRIVDMTHDIAENLTALAISLGTGERTAKGEIPGLKGTISAITPSAVSQLNIKEDSALDKAISSANEADKKEKEEAQSKWKELQAASKRSKEEARALVVELAKTNPDLVEKIAQIAKDEAAGLTEADKRTRQLDIENGDRARYVFGEFQKLDTKAARRDYLADLIKKGVVTDEVSSQIIKMIEADKPLFEEGQTTTKTGVIHAVSAYAKAFGVDPMTAFKALFTKEKLKYVKGNVVVLERIDVRGDKGSEAIAKRRAEEQGVDRDTMRLDHTIPLELGGDNNEKNLNLITVEQHGSYTPTENLLGKAVREGKIKRKEAQNLILRFKSGEITSEEVKTIVEN